MRKRQTKLFNYLIIAGLAILFAIWAAVFQNTGADTISSAKIAFLDVGQADAALLNLPDSTQVLFDAGRDGKTVEKVASEMPFFDKRIEFVVISHFDSDHIGGLDEVMRSYDVGKVLIAEAQKEQNEVQELVDELEKEAIAYDYVSKSDVVYFRAPVKGVVLWPESEAGGLSDNDLSLVVQIEGATKRVLMTGDIENKGQTYVFAKNAVADLDTDILKFPHHGAAGAFNQKLFDLTTPEEVIISVGKNSYGHPSGDLIDYLQSKMIDFIRTDEAGTVRIGL